MSEYFQENTIIERSDQHLQKAFPIYLKAHPIDNPDHLDFDEFPEGQDALEEALRYSCVHIGIFLAWIIKNDLISKSCIQSHPDEIKAVKNEKITGTTFFLNCCGEKLIGYDLSEEGLSFTEDLYDYYLESYASCYPLYTVEDTWESYHKIIKKINWQEVYEDWLNY